MIKSIEVELDNRTVTVSKLPIGRYAELLKAVKKLPEAVKGIDKTSTDDLMQNLPSIIGDALPDFLNILPIATPLKSEEVADFGLDEVVKLVVAVYEVNNYASVIENIKKALARQTVPSTPQA